MTDRAYDVIALGRLTRSGEFVPRQRAEGVEDDRVRELSFASEEPYLRYFGEEVLDHSPGAGDLSRLNNSGPVLLYHDTTRPVAVIEKAWLDKDARRSRATVRFGRGEAASDALRDVDDGILTHVSFAYYPKKMVLEEEREDGPSLYRVTRWEALEISLVTVAADDTVGVGRSSDQDTIQVPVTRKELAMSEQKNTDTVEAPAAPPAVDVRDREPAEAPADKSKIQIREAARQLRGVWKNADELADQAIAEGRTIEEFLSNCRTMGEREQPAETAPASLDLTEREKRRYNFLKAARAFADPGNQRLAEEAAFEIECSHAIEDASGRAPSSFFVPNDILARDLVVGTDSAGGYLVGTDHRGGEFVDLLRNRMLCAAMGARVVTDLKGDVSIPALTAGASGSWVAEDAAASETTQTLAQISLSPKTVTAWSEITKNLMMQSSPDAGDMVMNDLGQALSVALDKGALHGSGATNNPTGIASTSGIGSVVGGTNGADPTWSHITQLEEQVAIDNADVGQLGYMTNPKVRRKLKNTTMISGGTDSAMVWQRGVDRPLNDYPVGITNQVASNLDKGSSTGVCSAIFFGNWNDLFIGVWGGLDILVDPYSQSTTRKTRIVASLLCDIAVRRAVSFAAMLDATTAT